MIPGILQLSETLKILSFLIIFHFKPNHLT